MKVESLIALFEALNNAEVRYLVAGGLAVIAHGYTRLTMDVDMVISLDRNNIANALKRFNELRYRPRIPVDIMDFADPERRAMWITEKNMKVFSLFNPDPKMPPVDIFVREPFDFEEEYRKAIAFWIDEGIWIPVVGLETLVHMKQEANRDKDVIDISYLKILLADEDHEEK